MYRNIMRIVMRLSIVPLLFPLLLVHASTDSDNLFDLSLEELLNIEITSVTLFKTNVLELDKTVSVITKKQWELQGAKRNKDTLQFVNGVQVYDQLGGAQAFSVRGFANSDSTREVNSEIIDGIPLNRFSANNAFGYVNVNLGVLSKVELIKGPSSSLFGSDAFMSVYSMTSWDSDKNEVVAKVDVGTNTHKQAYINLSRFSENKNLQFTVNFAATDIDDTKTPYYKNSLKKLGTIENGLQSTSAIIKLKAKMGMIGDFDLGFYKFDNETLNAPGAGPTFTPVFYLGGKMDLENDSKIIKIGHNIDLENNLSIETSVYGSNSEHYHRLSVKTTDSVQDDNSIGTVIIENKDRLRILLRKQRASGKLQAAVGFELQNFEIEEWLVQKFPNITGPFVEQAASGRKRKITTLFLDASYKFNEKYLAKFGTRNDKYSDFGTQLTPRVSLIYHPSTNSALKFIYESSFRAPSAAELYGTGSSIGNLGLNPVTFDNYEFIYGKIMSNSKYNVTFHSGKWKDNITKDTTRTYQNSGESHNYGIELNGEVIKGDYRVEMNASYTRSFNDSVDTYNEFDLFPRGIINLKTEYNLADINSVVFMGVRTFFDAAMVENQGEGKKNYLRVDLGAKYDFNNLSLFFNVRNLFDSKNNKPSVFSVTDGIPEEGINVSIGLKAKF